MIDVSALVESGSHDVVFVVLDSLRFDVAERARREGKTPALASLFPRGWERRHTPATFTLPAHVAFFSGFLPTFAERGGATSEFFRARTPGAERTRGCLLFEQESWIAALAERGYRTICIGGVNFFNPALPLGRILPRYFAEHYWRPDFGPTSRVGIERQVDCALQLLSAAPSQQPWLLFLNVAATHAPTRIYAETASRDSCETQAAALAHVDGHLGRLVAVMAARRPLLAFVTSDHGDAFGDDGYWSHRVAHPSVWDVPFGATVVHRRHEVFS